MQIKPAGKIVVLILVLGLAVGGWRLMQQHSKTGGTSGLAPVEVEGDQGLLGRPLRVGIVTWPGYAGGITANNGFRPNKECIYWNDHKLLVQFMLMEDVDARAKAFARGGDDGVDIVWSTVDFWANELPGFLKGGLSPKVILQVDWSRGGDAIVADSRIRRIEDLKGKKVSLALFTPSHWLLENSLMNSSLDEADQSAIVKSLVGTSASPDARATFVSGKVDACVVWEPDVAQALKERPGSHILLSSKTAANLIADVMVARSDFIEEHPDVIKAFIQGWLNGTAEANRNPQKVVDLLMDNEPLYKDLGPGITLDNLSSVKWADLADNTRMFGLDGSPGLFRRIFTDASQAWVKRGYISQPASVSQAADTSFLKQIFAAVPVDVRSFAKKEEFKFPKQAPASKRTQPAIMTKPLNIYFASDSAALDNNAKAVLDQAASTVLTLSNAYIRVEGNTANVGGGPYSGASLSRKRAQSVVSYLVHRYGLNASRFIAVGNGASKPVASNATEAGQAKNRRTDIKVVER